MNANFVTRRFLPRRTFLRGLGVTVALPLLDSMVPALSALARTAANPVKRLGFVYIANGASMGYWTPDGEGKDFELSPILSPLAPFRDQLVIPTGLEHRQAEAWGDGNGEHSRSSAVWLNGVHPKLTEGADVRAGVTVDQIAAQVLGKDTPLPSLEVALDPNFLVGNCENGYSCVYMNTISWRSATTPNPMENNPRAVFERMFGDGGTAAERRAQMRKNSSILDWVAADMNRLQSSLGPVDRTRVNEYLDAVREIERRIQKAETQNSTSVLPDVLDRPIGIPEDYDDHAKLMFDLMALAYQADVTRVFTHMMCREVSSRVYPKSGVNDPHHPTSHHQGDPVKLEKLSKINSYHTSLFAGFLDKLKNTPDGEGSLLDHSLILYGGGISDADLHSHIDLPLVLVGGGGGAVKGGRLLKYPPTPMNNLLLTMLDKAGVPIDKLGDSTGPLPLDTLSNV